MIDDSNRAGSRQSSAAVAGDAQLPLSIVLKALADDLEDRQLSTAVHEMIPALDAGQSIEQALDACQSPPPYLAGLLQSATSSDQLAATCDSLVRLRIASRQTWSTMHAMLAYPIALFVALIGLSLLVAYYVVPSFAMLFDEFALNLPSATEWFLAMAGWIPWLLIGLFILFVAISLGPQIVGSGFALRNAMPVLGKLYVHLSQEELASTLASFVKLGTPLDKGLEYTSFLLRDRSLARATDRLSTQVKQGSSLAAAMHRSRAIDRSLAVIADWGEASSELGESLELAAQMFAERRRQRMHLLRRIIPPLTLVTVAAMTLSGVLPLLVPLISLISDLSG